MAQSFFSLVSSDVCERFTKSGCPNSAETVSAGYYDNLAYL